MRNLEKKKAYIRWKINFRFLFFKFWGKKGEILQTFCNIGGAGVTSGEKQLTSGEKQLTSGSGVAIYWGFTQETSQLLKKHKNYSHLQAIEVASVSLYKLSSANICFC